MKLPFIADVKAGESEEDAEARSLLNKFLGAQVMLQGMEPLVKASQSQSAALVSQVERQRVLASQKVGLNLIWVELLPHYIAEECMVQGYFVLISSVLSQKVLPRRIKLEYFWTRVHKFSKNMGHFKILGARRVPYQAHTNIRHHHTKLVATVPWHPRFVHPCFWLCLSLSISLRQLVASVQTEIAMVIFVVRKHSRMEHY